MTATSSAFTLFASDLFFVAKDFPPSTTQKTIVTVERLKLLFRSALVRGKFIAPTAVQQYSSAEDIIETIMSRL